MKDTVTKKSFAFIKQSKKFDFLHGFKNKQEEASIDLYDALVGQNFQSVFYLYANKKYAAVNKRMKELSELLLDELYNFEPIIRVEQKDWQSWNRLDYLRKLCKLAEWNLVDAKTQEKLVNESRDDLSGERGAARKIVDFYHILVYFCQRYEAEVLPQELREDLKEQNFFSKKELEQEIISASDLRGKTETDQIVLDEFTDLKNQVKGPKLWFSYLAVIVLLFIIGLVIKVPIKYVAYGEFAMLICMILAGIFDYIKRYKFRRYGRKFNKQRDDFLKKIADLDQEKEDLLNQIDLQQYPYPKLERGIQKFNLLETVNGKLITRNLYDWKLLKKQLVYDEHGKKLEKRAFSSKYPAHVLTSYADRFNQQLKIKNGCTISVAEYEATYGLKSWREKQILILKEKMKQTSQEIKNLHKHYPVSSWIKPEILRDDKALAMLQTVEYYGRDLLKLNENMDARMKHDLSRHNLTGTQYLNQFFVQYNAERRDAFKTFSNFARKVSDNDLRNNLLETLANLPDAKMPEQRAFKTLSHNLAGGAGERLVRWKLSQYPEFKVFHNIVFPSTHTNNAKTQIDHMVITRKGIFLLETKTRDLAGNIYHAQNTSTYEFKNQIMLHQKAIYRRLFEQAESKSRAARIVADKVLKNYALHNALLVINRYGDQKFTIDRPNFYRERKSAVNIQITNLNMLPDFLLHAGKDDFVLSDTEIQVLANILQTDLHDVDHEGWMLFPQINWNLADYLGNVNKIKLFMQGSAELTEKIVALKNQMQDLENFQNECTMFDEAYQLIGEENEDESASLLGEVE